MILLQFSFFLIYVCHQSTLIWKGTVMAVDCRPPWSTTSLLVFQWLGGNSGVGHSVLPRYPRYPDLPHPLGTSGGDPGTEARFPLILTVAWYLPVILCSDSVWRSQTVSVLEVFVVGVDLSCPQLLLHLAKPWKVDATCPFQPSIFCLCHRSRS